MDLLLNSFTTALGWSMLHSLWQGAAIYTGICLLYLLYPNSSASIKYRFAYGSQILMMLLFSYTFLHCLNIPNAIAQQESNNYLAITQYIQQHTAKITTIEGLFPWFSSLYILGLLMQLAFFSKSYNRLSYLRRQGLSEAPISWNISLDSIKAKLPINKKVKLHLSDKVASPLTIGHLKPIILFPIALVNQMDIQHVEAILLHELAHIKRNDYLFNLIGVLIETILFFNPFIWLLSRHIQTEREHACDDVVLEQTASPISYAQALVCLETIKQQAYIPFAMQALGKKQHLLHRIKRITKMEKNYINVKQHLFAIGISCIAFAMIAWIAPEEKQTVAINAVKESNLPPAEVKASILALDPNSRLLKTQEDTLIKKHSELSLAEIRGPGLLKLDSLKASPEWKDKIAKIEAKAKDVEAYYNSPEWKDKIAKVEAKAKDVEAYYNSPEWKDKIAKIEAKAKDIEAYYNSPEWKDKIAKIEGNGKKVEAYFNAPEWKDKITKIELNGKSVEAFFNSSEWKDKIAKIQESGLSISEMVNLNTQILTDVLNIPELQELKLDLELLKKDRKIGQGQLSQ